MLFDFILAFGIPFFTGQGNTKAVSIINKLNIARQSGQNIDAHMQEVADYMAGNGPLDWDQLDSNVDSAVASFLS